MIPFQTITLADFSDLDWPSFPLHRNEIKGLQLNMSFNNQNNLLYKAEEFWVKNKFKSSKEDILDFVNKTLIRKGVYTARFRSAAISVALSIGSSKRSIYDYFDTDERDRGNWHLNLRVNGKQLLRHRNKANWHKRSGHFKFKAELNGKPLNTLGLHPSSKIKNKLAA